MISLIHPSRGRPEKAKATAKYWLERSTTEVEHILSLDMDDPLLTQYEGNYILSSNKSVVEATNIAAFHAMGDILIYLSDDFKCPDDWDKLIIERTKDIVGPWLLKVNDNLQPFDVPVLTIPIMNRELYHCLGYFWNPQYKSMFVDEDLYWTVKKYGWLYFAPDLVFPHEHFIIGKAEKDETYTRTAAHWDEGKELFNKRKLAGFPL